MVGIPASVREMNHPVTMTRFRSIFFSMLQLAAVMLLVSSAVLLLCSCPASAAPAAAPEKKPASAGKTLPQEFPLIFKGKQMVISRQAKRAELEPALTKLLGAKTDMREKSVLQYDVQLNPNEGSMAAVFSWSKNGELTHLSLDAFTESQNPPAKELKRWLIKNAGPGKTTKDKQAETTTLTWNHRGWRFVFTEGGDGEDSNYSFDITPLKTS